MRRREFVTVLGGTAAAWPFVALAQQPERVRRVGVLMSLAEHDPEEELRYAAFVEELQKLGWTDGRNVRIDVRWDAGNASDALKFAAELIALAPDVILVSGGSSVAPVLQLTHTVPVVFTQTPDPVGAGFVESLARPGGNPTGFINFEYGMGAKWLELLKQIAPGVTRVAVLRDALTPQGIGQFAAVQPMAPSLGMEVSPVNVGDIGEMDRAVAAFARGSNCGLIVTGADLRSLIAS
jgi:putative tryptophan/tyrosine transport system substrate-binding protein